MFKVIIFFFLIGFGSISSQEPEKEPSKPELKWDKTQINVVGEKNEKIKRFR